MPKLYQSWNVWLITEVLNTLTLKFAENVAAKEKSDQVDFENR